MTRNQFVSAISRLTVRPGPEGFVIGRPLYLQAGRAFNLAGPEGFLWFRKRPVAAIDDNHVRTEFIEWLKDASDEEIDRFISDMELYRRELNQEVMSDVPEPRPGGSGLILSGEEGRSHWRRIHKIAGLAATPRKRMKEARLAIDREKAKLKIDARRAALRPLVIDLVATHPDEKPSGIATRLKRKPEFKKLALTVTRRTLDTDVGEIMEKLGNR